MEALKLINEVKKLFKTKPELFPEEIRGEDFEFTKETIAKLSEDNKEVQSFINSQKDSAVSKGIESFKEKTLPGLVNEKAEAKAEELYKQKHPEETPEQIEIRKLREKMEKSEREKKRSDLRNLAHQTLSKKKLAELDEIAPFFVADDEETTLANIEKVASTIEGLKTKTIENTTKELASKYGQDFNQEPPPGDDGGDDSGFSYDSMD